MKPSYIFIVIIVCLLTSHSIQVSYSNFNNKQITDGPFTEKSLEMFEFVETHTHQDDLIVFFKPRALSLMTGKRSIFLVNFEEIMKSSADYLIIHKGGDIAYSVTQLSPQSKEFLQIVQKFPIIFENIDFIIFRLKKLAEFE